MINSVHLTRHRNDLPPDPAGPLRVGSLPAWRGRRQRGAQQLIRALHVDSGAARGCISCSEASTLHRARTCFRLVGGSLRLVRPATDANEQSPWRRLTAVGHPIQRNSAGTLIGVQRWTRILGHRLPDRTPGQAQKPYPLSSLDLVGFSFCADRTYVHLKMHGQTAGMGPLEPSAMPAPECL